MSVKKIEEILQTLREGNTRNMVRWRYVDQVMAPLERMRLHNKTFSLLANTCVGASIYHKYSLPYNTPTIATLMVTEDYLRMLEDLRYYLKQPLRFAKESKHPGVEPFYNRKFPVGVLGEGDRTVEVLFLHEANEEVAFTKWTRRAARFNFDNIYIMMTDSGNIEFGEPPFNMEYVRRFESLPYKHKVLFSHIPINSPSVVYIKNNMKGIHVVENMMYNRKFERWMDVTGWLNER